VPQALHQQQKSTTLEQALGGTCRDHRLDRRRRHVGYGDQFKIPRAWTNNDIYTDGLPTSIERRPRREYDS